ncbi:TPA: hypothetical protein L3881_006050 [Pseudomonas aeruginosa]|uniref:hypothetical protein n=1 Tax=Pseudomonas aeruginosa TaxID=287 RepID=UPI0021F20520|nr:hypothetical protein [Pseudomonas aeruginosa]MCV4114377.1 hypothetical protein [Pseudomonas aeruginosa]MCV4245615.1 hypothetical protein [Pseudomonas aeruginosa]MCV4253347.1 hypothetical protein [Pseudomonas aeruginosa]MDP5918501.1 hypothetical protein [Pseudomonas aeruginosa]MED5068804.1 hypothetical protein [Pseudomonas aeruginosa]
MNRIWSLAKYSAIFFMVAGFIIPVVILTVYAGKYSSWWSWEWLGRISLNPNDWSAFGALLAGVFSLLGAAATTSTLLLVVYQYKLSRESMVLNQYISHRDVFIGRLKALESNFDGKIFFKFHDELYGRVFPDNKPTHVGLYENLRGGSGKANSLAGMYSSYRELSSELARYQFKEAEGREYIYKSVLALNDFQSKLGIIVSSKGDRFGDIFLDGKNTGINLYVLGEAYLRAEYVLNSYLFYSGNDTVKDFKSIDFEMLRGRMYDGIEQGRFRSNIYVQEDDFGILNALWKIFGFCSEEVYKNDAIYLRPVWLRLRRFFASADNVEEHMSDYSKMNDMLDSLLRRVDGKFLKGYRTDLAVVLKVKDSLQEVQGRVNDFLSRGKK